MAAVLLQTDDEWEVASYGRNTANNGRRVGLLPLSNGSGGDHRQSREADDEGLGAHGG